MTPHDPAAIEVCGCLFEPAGHHKNYATGEMDPVWWTCDIREDGPSGQEINARLVRASDATWSVETRGGKGTGATPEEAFADMMRVAQAAYRATVERRAQRALVTAVHIDAYGEWRCGETRNPDNGSWVEFMAPTARFGLVTCATCLERQIVWAEKNDREQLKELARLLRKLSQLEMTTCT